MPGRTTQSTVTGPDAAWSSVTAKASVSPSTASASAAESAGPAAGGPSVIVPVTRSSSSTTPCGLLSSSVKVSGPSSSASPSSSIDIRFSVSPGRNLSVPHAGT